MSSTEWPLFTVIMATWGRGRFILPSVRSVLQQDLSSFELLVVGDNCQDETADVVAGLAAQGVRWINLAERWGSQSGPNNAGLAAARGKYVAYIGHDDIWEPFHLSDLARLFAEHPGLDFGIGGTILYLPTGMRGHRVTGIFDTDEAKHSNFFPPSSIAHRIGVPGIIGPWPRPDDIVAPVDMHFLLRAIASDMQFASTGRVSVHKFTSGHRYLSYLFPSDDEQRSMLADMAESGHAARVDAIVAKARAMNTFMTIDYGVMKDRQPGEIARLSRSTRGLIAPESVPVGTGVLMRQSPMHCGMDWRPEPVNGVRWVGRNPRPRVLLPYTASAGVRMTLQMFHSDPAALAQVDMRCNGDPVTARIGPPQRRGAIWMAVLVAILRLRSDAPSALEFRLDPLQALAERRRGIGIGNIELRPLAGADA